PTISVQCAAACRIRTSATGWWPSSTICSPPRSGPNHSNVKSETGLNSFRSARQKGAQGLPNSDRDLADPTMLLINRRLATGLLLVPIGGIRFAGAAPDATAHITFILVNDIYLNAQIQQGAEPNTTFRVAADGETGDFKGLMLSNSSPVHRGFSL